MSSVSITSQGAARILTIDRPGARNALDRATLRAVIRAAKAIRRDRDARGVVVTGGGTTFIAGGDLRDLAPLRSSASGRAVAALGHAAIDSLRDIGLPLVAAINGDAHGGGCELATACDYRVFEEHVRLHWVQGRIGLTTGWGGTGRLVALVGPSVATRWLLGARSVDAAEAFRVGFASEIVATGASVAAACAFIGSMADAVPKATTRAQLGLLRAAADGEDGRARESDAFARLWSSRAHHEAVARFLARPSTRPPA